MAKPAARIAFLQGCLALAAAVVVARAFQVSVVQHAAWDAKADDSRYQRVPVQPRRGTIFDRNGEPLAVTMDRYHVSVATEQLRDTTAAVARLARALGKDAGSVAARIRTQRNVYFHGPYTAQQWNQLSGIDGIYRERVLSRAYPRFPRAAPLLGSFDSDSARGRGGLEQAYDTLLRGTPGLKVMMKDSRGRLMGTPDSMVTPAEPGSDVYLTIDANLQVIAENELERALGEYQAENGDIVILNVHTGEVLAIASLRTQGTSGPVATPSALIEPYEPGSTAKIFTAAAVLREGLGTKAYPGYGGVWMMPYGTNKERRIEDVHKIDGLVTLADAIKHSSNIAISQFALELTEQQHYRALRDFGFGTSPTVGFPGEGAGKLVRPAQWDNRYLSQASLAQGYEFMSTALQMASAYAVLANGGKLIAPTLVREVRAAGATTTWRHEPQVVREVISAEVARQAMAFLALAADSTGTGNKAQLDRISVIGKTGTAKHVVNGQYSNLYRASFAGVYPGDRPQVVIYVMIDKPRGGSYYGGVVAAPVVKSILQQGLSILKTPLDRSTLAAAVLPQSRPAPKAPSPSATRVVALHGSEARAQGVTRVALPTTLGLDVRSATYTLHQRGMIVKAVGHGTVRSSTPAAGDSLPPGSIVTVYADSTR